MFNGIPRIALAPLFIIWFGIGPNSKVVLVVTVVFFLTFFNTYATVPWITTGLKISVPYAIVGEFIAASRGLGYLINYYTGLFSTTGALAGIIIVALIVVLSSEAINWAEAYLLRWRPTAEARPAGGGVAAGDARASRGLVPEGGGPAPDGKREVY